MKRKHQVKKEKVLEEKEGMLSRNIYEVEDFMSMDHFAVNPPSCLPLHYGRESNHNKFNGSTIFHDATNGIIWVKNQVSLGEVSFALKNSFGSKLQSRSSILIVTMVSLQLMSL